jgi:hypothetical protein
MILSDSRLEPVACSGILVIGDPHVGSRRPGRRTDDAWPRPVMAKLERCVAIANERDLVPVILGDLFDRPVERDMALTSQLIRILQGFRRRAIVNVGNHDIAHTTLSDGDSLALLGLCDVIDVVAVSGPVATLSICGRRLGLGVTPYGQTVPDDVRGAFQDTQTVAWFTHHDIAFDAAYPGAVPPHGIAGCDFVVNGHVHKTQKAIDANGTRWHNPGNIARQSVDLKDHVPRAWILDPDGALAPEVLPYESEVFDLTGRLVEAANEARVAAVESAFVSLLQAQVPAGIRRSDDGALVREEIEARFSESQASDAVQAIVRSLLDEAVERSGHRA